MSQDQNQDFDVFAFFATDEEAELKGVEFPIGKSGKLLIARANNRNYAKVLSKFVDANRDGLENPDEDAAADLNDKVLAQVMARTILLGWSGLSFKGVHVEYSVEKAEELLAVKDFRRKVAELASSMEAYRVKTEDAQGKA